MYKYVSFDVVDHQEGTQIKSVKAIFFTENIHSFVS
jgi:hypothetical protein